MSDLELLAIAVEGTLYGDPLPTEQESWLEWMMREGDESWREQCLNLR